MVELIQTDHMPFKPYNKSGKIFLCTIINGKSILKCFINLKNDPYINCGKGPLIGSSSIISQGNNPSLFQFLFRF